MRRWLLEPIIRQIAALREELMATEAENYAKLTATVEQVKTGWASLVAERDQYRVALEQADANQAQAVADALEADSAHDAEAIAAVDASLSELVAGQSVEVPSEGGDEQSTDVPTEA